MVRLLVSYLIAIALLGGDDILTVAMRALCHPTNQAAAASRQDDLPTLNADDPGASPEDFDDDEGRRRVKFMRARIFVDYLCVRDVQCSTALAPQLPSRTPAVCPADRPLFTWFCSLLI